MTFTEGAQCTSNFVFRDGGGTYLGQAAHCSGTGEATDTNGCDAGTLPLGTPVEIDGAAAPARSSAPPGSTMQRNGEANEDACAYNDFALVKVDPADVTRSIRPCRASAARPRSAARARCSGTPSSPTATPRFARASCSSAPSRASSSRATERLEPHRLQVTPGVPGDSGSGFISDTGQAIGTLSTLAIAPLPASNASGTSNLARLHAGEQRF